MKSIKIYLAGVFTFTLLGCTSQGPDVTQGECITPVDGTQIYKVTRLDGKSIYARAAEEAIASSENLEMMIPETMHYVKIPCP